MNRRRGFTLIELLVTITIMVTLLILAVVSLRSSQVTARDKEREADAASIAAYLENLYNNGDDKVYPVGDGTYLGVSPGTYPYAGLIANSCDSTCTTATSDYSTNTNKLESLFGDPGFDLKSLKAPDQTSYSLVVAQSATPSQQTTTGLTSPKPTINTYVYQPIMYTGYSNSTATLCKLKTDSCRSFNLFYVTESDNVVHKITSKHQ